MPAIFRALAAGAPCKRRKTVIRYKKQELGERGMEANVKVWVKAPCEAAVRGELLARFGAACSFRFAEDEGAFAPEQAQVVIGEPDREELLAAENLRWVQLTWAGVDRYVPMQDALRGAVLTNASGAFGGIIAEYAVGAIIALYRGFPQYWDNQKRRIWVQQDRARTIFGTHALLLGTGDLGRNLARRLRALGADVTGVRRSAGAALADFDRVCSLSELDELLPQADIVVGCLPDTPETRGLLTCARLRAMKPDAVFVNVGRGSLAATEDLVSVLQSGHLLGAALDVLDEEPLPENSPLWALENVILTPHIAGPSFGGNRGVQDAIWGICMENLARYLRGERLKNVVDLAKGY